MPLRHLVNPNEEVRSVYTQLNNMIFRIIVGVLLAGMTGWGAYINSRINEVDTIKNDIVWIKEALKDIQEQQRLEVEYMNRNYLLQQEENNAKRHNP